MIESEVVPIEITRNEFDSLVKQHEENIRKALSHINHCIGDIENIAFEHLGFVLADIDDELRKASLSLKRHQTLKMNAFINETIVINQLSGDASLSPTPLDSST